MRFSCQAGILLGLAAFLWTGGQPVLAEESAEAGNWQYRAASELQRDGQFELAVAAWNQFLEKNPDHAYVPQATLNLGICYLKSKQYDKALTILRQVLDKYPEAPFREAAYLYLGVTQFSLGHEGQKEQYQAAARTLSTLLHRYPGTKYLAPALYYRAETEYALGKKETAAKLYSRLVREFPNGKLLPDALYALGTTQQELGQFQAAGRTYNRFLKTSPEHPRATEVMMRRGEALFGTKQFASAAGWFAKAAAGKNFAMADQAWMRQADCLAQLKRYDQAANLYAELAKKFPNSSLVERANLAAGKCYYLAGNSAKALDVLAKVIAARGTSLPEATHWSARSLLKQDKPGEAVALLEKTLSEAGGSRWEPQLRLDLADATYEMPKLRNISITLYSDVVDKFPKDPVADSALYMAAFTALQQGDYETALNHAQRFFENYTESNLLPDVAAVAAECELQLNKLEDAQRRYQELISRYPTHPEVPSWRLRRGLILYMQEKYIQTIGVIQPIMNRLRSKAAKAEAYYLLGSSLLQQGRLDEAIDALRSSVLADPNWRQADDTLLILADALRQKGLFDQATKTINHLITTFPKSPLLDQAHFWLAEFAYNHGKMAEAAREYQGVIRGWPKSQFMPHALFGLGWAQLSEKKYAEAEKTFDRLVTEFPKNDLLVWARFARGTALQQLGKFGPAIEDINVLLATNPEGKEKSDALYVLGLCQAGLKKYDEAIKTFESLLQQDPEYSGADKTRYELAWALKDAGKKDDAIAAFMQLANDYPASPLSGESLYHAAETRYDQKRYDEAVKIYQDIAKQTTDPLLKEKALHKIAWSYFNQEQYDRARSAFDKQRKTVPEGKLLADAAFMEAECLAKSGKLEAAITAYQHMLNMPQKPLGDDFEALAWLHASQAAGKLKQWDKCTELLKQAANALRRSPFLPDILFEQAKVQEKLGHLDEAEKLYADVPIKTKREVAARSQLRLGKILAERKDYAKAIPVFYEVIYGGYKFPKWQAEATYEAGRCFEILGKNDQAVKLYRELLEKYPKSDKAPSAKKHLESLE